MFPTGLNRAIIVVLAVALSYFVVDKFWLILLGHCRFSFITALFAFQGGTFSYL